MKWGGLNTLQLSQGLALSAQPLKFSLSWEDPQQQWGNIITAYFLNYWPWVMTSVFQKKDTYDCDLWRASFTKTITVWRLKQGVEIKTADLTNSAIHSRYLMDRVYSCDYNMLLGWIHQTPAVRILRVAEKGYRCEAWVEESQSQTPDVHRSPWTTAGIQGNAAAPKTEPGSCHHPLVKSQPFPSQQLQELHSSFPSGDRGLCCFLRAEFSLLWEGRGEWELSPKDSKVIRQAHSGNNYGFLSPGNKALKYYITFLPANPMIFIFCYTLYTLSTWIISAKQCYKRKKQMIVLSNSIKI